MNKLIRIGTIAIFILVAASLKMASEAAQWQTPGTGCKFYDLPAGGGATPIASGYAIQHAAGRVGSFNVFCPITNVAITESTNFALYAQDPDGANGNARVFASVSRIKKATGVTEIVCLINSDHRGKSGDPDWQQLTTPCLITPFDTNTYYYHVAVSLSRTTTSLTPKLFGVELY